MKTIICDKLPRITKNKARLEKLLNIKITTKGKEVSISGNPEDEYIAEKVIDALNFGFPFSTAMSIKKDDTEFEIINIKDHTKTHNLERVRGRIIGKAGKTLKTISTLSNCHFEIKDNQVGIIGHPEHLKNAQDAIISIAKGTKQSNIYKFLENHHPEPVLDLGLKE